MWIALSLLTALFYALSGTYSKKIMDGMDRYTVTWAMFSFALPFVALPVLFTGIPEVKPQFYLGGAGTLLINMVAFTMFMKALKLSPLSLTYPFLSFTPVFLIFTGYVFLGELPNVYGVAGIFLTAAGAYVLNMGRIKEGFFAPMKAITKEKGSMLMLGVSFLWSFASTFDKIALLGADPYFFILAFNTGFTILYFPFLKKVNPGFKREVTGNYRELLLLGALSGIMVIFQMVALETAYVSYVIAIKRSGMIFTLLLGRMFFDEDIDFFRTLGTVMMASGVFLIALYD